MYLPTKLTVVHLFMCFEQEFLCNSAVFLNLIKMMSKSLHHKRDVLLLFLKFRHKMAIFHITFLLQNMKCMFGQTSYLYI